MADCVHSSHITFCNNLLGWKEEEGQSWELVSVHFIISIYLQVDPPQDQNTGENQPSTGEEGHCTGEEEAPMVHRCNLKHPCMLGVGLWRALDWLA